MLRYAKATEFNRQLTPKNSKLIYPAQNLIDLVWKDKPLRSREPIYIHPMQFSGKSALDKLADIRSWIRKTPPVIPSYSKSAPTPDQYNVATLITTLDSVCEQSHDSAVWEKTHRPAAYVLNLRGQDIPFDPLFHSYLMITLDKAILFVDHVKLTDDVEDYLKTLNVDTREYNDLWSYLRKRECGDGKVSFLLHVPVSDFLVPGFKGHHHPRDAMRDRSHAYQFPIHCDAFLRQPHEGHQK